LRGFARLASDRALSTSLAFEHERVIKDSRKQGPISGAGESIEFLNAVSSCLSSRRKNSPGS
jgi:hypothetical protein